MELQNQTSSLLKGPETILYIGYTKGLATCSKKAQMKSSKKQVSVAGLMHVRKGNMIKHKANTEQWGMMFVTEV